MDIETIIFLVICGISIAGSLLSAKNKAKEQKNDASYEAKLKPNPYANLLADLKAHEKAQQREHEEAQHRAHAKAKKRTAPVAPTVPQAATASVPQASELYSLPEEGIRVTKSKTKIEETPQQRSGLHDKENLKRAIIFGQILEPKF
ncbi:MAG: hypothetical protein LIP09_16335 [Bacteroidales bacterium]|nr:hypothetical protein [Bacteroidales bacterium]